MSAPIDDLALLRLARDGDQIAFSELARAYHSELHAHCYRMLGSVHDADDALQDAMLRAWRGLGGFQGRSSVRSWLYVIATNAAIDLARRRSRRELPVSFGPPAALDTEPDAPLTEVAWLDPYPGQRQASDVSLSPEGRYELRESVELAFVAALQHLPPLQRAVLLLREVVGLSTMEISSQLGTSTAAVNSALQRARAAVRRRLPSRSQQSTLRMIGDQRTRAIAGQYADAIERGDADRLISMLTEDATWSMPPLPTWYRGHEAIMEFLVRYPLTQRWKHQQTWANGQLAVGCYLFSQVTSEYVPAVIDVLTLDGHKIAAVTAFLTPLLVEPAGPGARMAATEMFARFGLPPGPP